MPYLVGTGRPVVNPTSPASITLPARYWGQVGGVLISTEWGEN